VLSGNQKSLQPFTRRLQSSHPIFYFHSWKVARRGNLPQAVAGDLFQE